MQIQTLVLPEPRQNKFRSWLDQEEFNTLIEVLGAVAFANEIDAVNSRMKNTVKYEIGAQDKARKADDAYAAIKLLNDLRAQKNPFSTATANPNTQPTD